MNATSIHTTSNTAGTQLVAAGDVDIAHGPFGGASGLPLVPPQHFLGNLDNRDPALVDALAAERDVIVVDYPRACALEALSSAEDYDADLAEQYGWISQALPAESLGAFVRALAERIAGFPAAGLLAIKDRINAITLAPTDDFRRDSDLFGEQVRTPEAQRRIQAAMHRGWQTRHAEMEFANIVDALGS